MRISAGIAAIAAGFVTLGAQAACENPTLLLSLPQGDSSTLDQMIEAQTAVKEYMGQMETYLACLNDDIETAGDDAAAEFKTLLVTRYNTAVVEMETVAAAFNEQLQAYRAANPSE